MMKHGGCDFYMGVFFFDLIKRNSDKGGHSAVPWGFKCGRICDTVTHWYCTVTWGCDNLAWVPDVMTRRHCAVKRAPLL